MRNTQASKKMPFIPTQTLCLTLIVVLTICRRLIPRIISLKRDKMQAKDAKKITKIQTIRWISNQV